MTTIQAFVGHSFASDDDAVITAFLRYFDQIQKMNPAFSWVDAQVAEPTELARKVLGMVEGRNVFVGICTKKERVIQAQKLSRNIFFGDRLSAKANDIEWKTSDWIIQEIGLAVGRGMSVILLLEEGCRKPGGLQGDVEFIPFDRSNPERAFGRVLEMITALVPAFSPTETASPVENSTTADEEIVEEPSAVSDDLPDESWDYEQYETSFIWKLFSKDDDGASAIESAYVATVIADNPEKHAEWLTMANKWRLLVGRGGDIEKVKNIRGEYPHNAEVIKNLAQILETMGNHAQAALEYEEAAEKVADRLESERLRGRAAIEFAKDGNMRSAHLKLSRQRKRLSAHPDEELTFLNSMKQIAELEKDISLQLHTMERISEIDPENWDNRFQLAYLYSNNKYEDLSLHHYLKIPVRQRTAVAWNNLGVAFQHFSMPAKSVEAYRRSSSEGETLAMSNLSYKLMEVGFVEEAKSELKKALSQENYHRNVGQAMTNLQDIAEKEDKKLEATLSDLKPKVEFFKRVGLAVASADVALESGIWTGPDCPLAIHIKDGMFTGFGKYEKPKSALAAALSTNTSADKFEVYYHGVCVGRRVLGTVERKKVNDAIPKSLLSGNDDPTECAMIVDAERNEISVAERLSTPLPRFYSITKSSEPNGEGDVS